MREELARAIHQDYVRRADASRDPDADPDRLVSYEDLPEEAKESNRGQAEDIALKIEMIDAKIVPLADSGPATFRFTRKELDSLSRHEHERWMRAKREAGWRYGPVMDPFARTHSCLVDYDSLSEEEKAKDRRAVQRIPGLLRSVGLGIVRRYL